MLDDNMQFYLSCYDTKKTIDKFIKILKKYNVYISKKKKVSFTDFIEKIVFDDENTFLTKDGYFIDLGTCADYLRENYNKSKKCREICDAMCKYQCGN